MKCLKLDLQSFFNPREKNTDQYFSKDHLNLPKEMTTSGETSFIFWLQNEPVCPMQFKDLKSPFEYLLG